MYFTYEDVASWAVTHGQLTVSGVVRGASPGISYGLVGGDCDFGGFERVWATGIADAVGTVAFTGPAWSLPKAAAYYLRLEEMPTGAKPVPRPGLEGIFVLGQALPIGEQHAPCL